MALLHGRAHQMPAASDIRAAMYYSCGSRNDVG
jgi:hypothetical protein